MASLSRTGFSKPQWSRAAEAASLLARPRRAVRILVWPPFLPVVHFFWSPDILTL